MVAITPESPVASVFGRSPKRKLVEEGLGITTVGELLRSLLYTLSLSRPALSPPHWTDERPGRKSTGAGRFAA